MLKFFRKIRQNLLMENKTGKYLKYAIGEIVLVVVGILIALQINNWNQNRLNTQTEAELLQAISSKMKFNIRQHTMGSTRYKSVIEAAEALLIASNDPTIKIHQNKIDEHFSTLSKRFLMGKSNATMIYDEMIGSGQLILLKSAELRSELTSLKANMQLLAAYGDEHLNFVDNQLSPYLNENIDILRAYQNAKQDGYDNILALKLDDIPLKPLSVNKVITERKFSNLMVELIMHTKTLVPIYSRINQNITIIDSIASLPISN